MSLSTSALTSYVPELVISHLAAGRQRPLEARFDTVVLFADISGFTALSERLAAQGHEGAERLSETLNATFGPIIDTILNAGGDLVKFAGDAVLALWPAADAAAARAAAEAAEAIQRQMRAQSGAADLALKVRIGIAAGPVSAMHVGGVYGRWELLLSGPALQAVAQAKQQVQPGQIGMAPAAAALLAHSPAAPPAPRRSAPAPTPPDLEAALRSYIPAAFLSRLDAGQRDWLAELRRVSVLFVNLPALTGGAELAQAHAAMAALQRALYRYEGSVNKISLDDKGVTAVAAFGLPPFAHEDDPIRALLAAREIGAVLAAQGLASATGLASGEVFCGSIGNQRRREYTIIGTAVNLAARLMEAAGAGQQRAAEGQPPAAALLCDAVTARTAQGRIDLEGLPCVRVKGRGEPVAVYQPRPASDGLGPAAPRTPPPELVGRAEERAAFTAALEQLGAGRGGVLGIEGEPGIGKSRLAAALAEQARAHGQTPLHGAADAVERDTPYYAWRPVIAALLGLEEGDLAARRARVLERLAQTPGLLERAPLLNSVLPLDLPDNDLTAQLQGPARADNLHELLLHLLARQAGRGALVIILEDAHWFDSASWGLALLVQRQLPQALLVLTTRPADEPPLHTLRAASAAWLRLEPLSHIDILTLLCGQLGVTSLPVPLAELIRARAEGNPFFSGELVAMLRQSGVLEIAGGAARLAPAVNLSELDIPDTVQGVIVSRIDRLRPEQQLALKVASVIGRQFPLRLLHAVYPVVVEPAELAGLLEDLRQIGIIQLDTPDPERTYLFKHVIAQEATYGLLPYAQRRALHQAVAEWYERTHAADLGASAALLAHHWRRASQTARALDYLELAARQSLAAAAYRETIRAAGKALALGADASPLRRASWSYMLGEAQIGQGQIAAGRAALEQGLAALGWPTGTAPPLRLLASVGRAAAKQAPLLLGLDGRGQAPPEDTQAVQILIALGLTYYYNVELVPMVYSLVQAALLQLHPAVTLEVAGAGFSGLALLCTTLRQTNLSRRLFARGQQIAAQARHLPMITTNHFREGVAWTGVGDLEAAQRAFEASIRLAVQLRDPLREFEGLLFCAWVLIFRGRWEHVPDLCDRLEALALRSENHLPLIWTTALRAMMALYCQHDQTAAELLRDITQSLDTPIRSLRSSVYACLARAELACGHLEAARAALDQSLRSVGRPLSSTWGDYHAYLVQSRVCLAEWAGAPAETARRRAARRACLELSRFALVFPLGEAESWQSWGGYSAQLCRPALARLCYRRALHSATRLGQPYEAGQAHAALARHTHGPQRRRHLAHAIAIFARLGAQHDLRRAVAEARKRKT